jgi:hypothetical protein
MIRKGLCCSIAAYFLISLGGFLIHLRIHPPFNFNPFEIAPDKILPFLLGLVSVFVLPFMFNCKRTVLWAVMLNLLIVSAGTVSMIYHSATHWKAGMAFTIPNLMLETTLAYILILFAKVPIAHHILQYWENQDN